MTRPDSRVRVAEAASGARTYLVDLPPEALPPVRARDLHAAWDSARGAALSEQWGRPLLLRFHRPGATDAPPTDLALADSDACCWAAAVDRTVGLTSPYGMSLCLRLLALIDLLPRAPWAQPLVAINRDGASIHPALLRAAAETPLAPDAGFDPAALHHAVQHQVPTTPRLVAPTSPGARA